MISPDLCHTADTSLEPGTENRQEMVQEYILYTCVEPYREDF